MSPQHRFSFRSTGELVEIVRQFGIHWQVAQISRGPLLGSISLKRRNDIAVLQLSTNQIITVLGARPSSITCIGLERTSHLSDHRVRGETISPFSIHGVTPSITESFFQISAGAEMTRDDEPEAIPRADRAGPRQPPAAIDRSNTLTVAPEQFQHLMTLLDHNQNHHTRICWMRCCWSASAAMLLSKPGRHAVHRAALMRDLLAWGLDNPDAPISLDQLTHLFASRSSIVQACRETFGVGPTTLLKQIRLHEVHQVLSDPSRRSHLNGQTSVGIIAGLHGFKSPNHFARDYRLMFGELPRKTLQRTHAA